MFELVKWITKFLFLAESIFYSLCDFQVWNSLWNPQNEIPDGST